MRKIKLKYVKNDLKNELNDSTGITLIALLISIIIIIILVGVSINLVVGENGIVNQTIKSREIYENASEYEEIKMAIMESFDGSLVINITNLKESLKGIIKETSLENLDTSNNKWCVEGLSGKKYIIFEDGTVMTPYEYVKNGAENTYYSAVPVIHDGKYWIRTGFNSIRIIDNYLSIESYGILYNNDGTVNNVSDLVLENVDGVTVKVKYKSRTNFEDKGYGVICVAYVKYIDDFGNEVVIYSEDIGRKIL